MHKFNLKDRVLNNKLGPIMIAGVVGILDATTIQDYFGVPLDKWDKEYPGWLSKSTYLVKTNQPQKALSLQEYLEIDFDDRGDYKDLPEQTFFIFPEEDLVLFDDDLN